MVGCGFLLDRRSRLDLGSLVRLNIYVFVPAFMFVSVVSSDLAGAKAARVIGFTATIITSTFVLAAIVARLLRYDRSHTRALQLAAMFYNSANYGIPLMALAFPGTGPALQVFNVLTQNVTTFTVGIALTASAGRPGWRVWLPVLRQLSLWAIFSGLLVRWLHLPVQQIRWIWVPLEYCSHALVAVALVTLGVQLSQTRVRQSIPRLGWALGLRLLVAPLLAVALVPLFGFKGEEAAIMIVSTSFPTAVNIALLAHEFKADSHFAAAAVFYSTLFSMLTVTLLIAVLRGG